MKKFISVILAIVMCFTMTTVAFAADEETPEVSKDGIIAVLLEAAKIASDLNSETREILSEELEKVLVQQIAGDSVILQKAAQWILDNALKLSGADNLLTLDKEQAEKLAEILTKMYDGNIADYIDNPFIKIIVSFIPEEVMKEAVVWILSDGFGEALQDFIDKYGDGETGKDEPVVEEKPDNSGSILDGFFGGSTPDGFDLGIAAAAAIQALKDVVTMVIDQITAIFGGAQTTPTV